MPSVNNITLTLYNLHNSPLVIVIAVPLQETYS